MRLFKRSQTSESVGQPVPPCPADMVEFEIATRTAPVWARSEAEVAVFHDGKLVGESFVNKWEDAEAEGVRMARRYKAGVLSMRKRVCV